MHLSLWTVESRDYVQEWSVKKFPKIAQDVITSWMNLHLFAVDRHSQVTCIASEEMLVSSADLKPNLFLLLLAATRNDNKPCQLAVEHLLSQLQCVLLMFANFEVCRTLPDYRSQATMCSWAITNLLELASDKIGRLPWSMITQTPETVLAYSSALFQKCLCESMTSPLACILSHGRILAATPSWSGLALLERVCLSLLICSSATIADCVVTVSCSGERASYRLVQVELVQKVVLVLLCGSQLSLSNIRDKILKYWMPLVDDLTCLEAQNLVYASVEGVPTNLRSFFLQQPEFTMHGFMQSDDSVNQRLEDSMKQLMVRHKSRQNPGLVRAAICSVVDRSADITFVTHESDDGQKVFVLAFDGVVKASDLRQLVVQIDTKFEHWLQSSGHL